MARLRGKYDLEFFTEFYFGHYARHPFNGFHLDYFADPRIGARRVRRARAAPRGYAKSTICVLVRPIHDGCYGFENYIVFFSASDPLAIGKVKDVRAELLGNPLLHDHFEIRFNSSRPGQSQFEVTIDGHEIRYEAHGRGVEVRGSRKQEHRPSKILLDDVEDTEDVESEVLREKDLHWYQDVVTKLGDENTNIEVVGTILHPQSLLAGLLKNPVYDGRIYRAIERWPDNGDLWLKWREIFLNLDDPQRAENARAFYESNRAAMDQGAKLLWPERDSLYQLQLEILESGMRSFQKEKQNDPQRPEDATFQVLHWYRETEAGYEVERSGRVVSREEAGQHFYGALDPSTGQTKAKAGSKLDYAALVSGFYHRATERLFVHNAWLERAPPSKQIERVFDHHELFKYQKVAIEDNLYRNILETVFVAERKRRQAKAGVDQDDPRFRVAIHEVRNTENKNVRIYGVEPRVTNGFIVFNRALEHSVFMEQLTKHPRGEHDDGPDALEMLWNLARGRYRGGTGVGLNVMGGR